MTELEQATRLLADVTLDDLTDLDDVLVARHLAVVAVRRAVRLKLDALRGLGRALEAMGEPVTAHNYRARVIARLSDDAFDGLCGRVERRALRGSR